MPLASCPMHVLSKYRWFAAKDRPIKTTRVVERIDLAPHARASIVEVVFADDGDVHHYLLPETDDSVFALAILDVIRCGGERAGEIIVGPGDEVMPLSVDQSNTSMVIGGKLVVKIYRRLVFGSHPEIEIGRFLTNVAHYPHVPPLLGAVEVVNDAGVPMALAALMGFIANRGNGWDFIQNVLRRELDQGVVPPVEWFEETLGQRLAELHHAFSLYTGDVAFDPEPMTGDDMRGLMVEVANQAEIAFAAIIRSRPQLDEIGRVAADRLLSRRGDVLERIADFDSIKPCWLRTRHHGDFHLGQVLVVDNDVMLIDFEGEPSRSLEQRRAKKSSLRDVVGMIRSFDYAAWVALASVSRTEGYEKLKVRAMAWRDLATRKFLDAYLVAARGSAGFPSDQGSLLRVLDLLLLEKVFYEVAYESANRPSWVVIPIAGALDILDRQSEKEGARA